jgi:hypothetical protein
MDRNKLAALASELGGISEAADSLGIDATILENAINGDALSRYDRADIDFAYANLEKGFVIDTDTILDNIDEIVKDSELSASIQDRIDYLGLDAVRNELENFEGDFADLTAKEHRQLTELFNEDNTSLDFDSIDNLAETINDSVALQGYEQEFTDGFYKAVASGQITPAQVEDLYTLWGNLTNYQANEIINKFMTDKDFTADELTKLYLEEEDLFLNYEDSEFWRWFRETFYNE